MTIAIIILAALMFLAGAILPLIKDHDSCKPDDEVGKQ